jgi:hypothetical protein
MRAALLVLVSACSFFTTEGPARPPGPTKCNYHGTPVAVDAAIAVAAALASAVSSFEHGGTGDVVGPAAVSGVFVGSTAYGLVQVHRCRVAHELRPQPSLADMPAVM